jgi:hypothetical protein
MEQLYSLYCCAIQLRLSGKDTLLRLLDDIGHLSLELGDVLVGVGGLSLQLLNVSS